MLDQKTFLLQNHLNPFPVPGLLVLGDDGRLSFELDGRSAGAALGWLEKRMSVDGLKDKITGGAKLVAFDVPVEGRKIAWPKTLGGYAMKFDDGDDTWIVSLNQPSGGGLWTTLNMLTAGKHTKPWKEALAAAGAA